MEKEKDRIIPVLEHNILPEDLYLMTKFFSLNSLKVVGRSIAIACLIPNGSNI
jgi:hypothetical protein